MLTRMRRASSAEPGATGRRQGTAAAAAAKGGEHQRVHQPDLRRDELDHVERLEAVRRGAAELLDERRPAVPGVPDDEGREDRRGDRQRSDGSRRDEPSPQRRRRCEGERDARGEKGGGEFRQQHEAERDADREKPSRLAGPPQFDQRREAQRPEHDQRRVGRREHCARHHERHADPHQDGERRRLGRPEEAPGDEGDQGREGADEEERQGPDAELRAAEKGGRGADEEGDHRRMVEIAEGERSRPERVIGLVEGELEAPGGHSLQGEERDRSADGESGQKACAGGRSGRSSATMEASLTVVAFASLRPVLQRPRRTGAAGGQRSRAEPSDDCAIHVGCGAVHTPVGPDGAV